MSHQKLTTKDKMNEWGYIELKKKKNLSRAKEKEMKIETAAYGLGNSACNLLPNKSIIKNTHESVMKKYNTHFKSGKRYKYKFL